MVGLSTLPARSASAAPQELLAVRSLERAEAARLKLELNSIRAFMSSKQQGHPRVQYAMRTSEALENNDLTGRPKEGLTSRKTDHAAEHAASKPY
eukprot:1860433-Pleurochrysis_carterae.AAC.2